MVTGVLLKWFESYVRDRKQCIYINGIQSPLVKVKYGGTPGLCTGPQTVHRYGLNIHLHADDTQIYIALETSSHTGEQVAIKTIQACIEFQN